MVTMKPKPITHLKSQQPQSETPSNPSDFAFKISQIAVSQICQSVGFKSAKHSALETLTHVATIYLRTLAAAATSYSNASNRTQSNLLDLTNALHDLSPARGFTGASMLHKSDVCSLSSSGVLKDIAFFVNSTDEIPFAKPLPRQNSLPPTTNSNPSVKHRRGGGHIPEWLPGFPDESTYKEKEMGSDKRAGGELALWERSNLVESSGGEDGILSLRGSGGGGELMGERGRVRFRIGGGEKERKRVEGGRNGVCRGGKRVCLGESKKFNLIEEGGFKGKKKLRES